MTDTSAAKLKTSPDALRAKYLAERDKRLRADGSNQYVDFERVFDYIDIDPYVEQALRARPCAKTSTSS
jgi:cyclohexanone monooxygenase